MSELKKKFFVIVPPGFEKLACRELEARGYELPTIESPEAAIRGGIELDLTLASGYQLNKDSHLATRVLERLEKWRCRDFPKLFNKTQTVSWENWVTGPFEVEVSAHRSRLMNKKRIAETVSKGIEARLKKNPGARKKPNPKISQEPLKIFVRFNNDEVEMSLDTSGEALFKRGYKTLAEAAAPIRENLAAAVFWAIYERAGRPQDMTVIDPNCGTGTLLTEAAGFFKAKPVRNYAYEAWTKAPIVGSDYAGETKVQLIGLDRDSGSLENAKVNAASLGVQIQLSQTDFLKTAPNDLKALIDSLSADKSMRIGIANPPYGERIKWPVPPKQFYAGLIEFFKASDCKVYGFIVPRQKARDLPQAPFKIDFENGGIPVSLIIYGSARNH